MALLKMSITLSHVEKETLDKVSKKMGESRSSLIRKAINYYIEHHKGK